MKIIVKKRIPLRYFLDVCVARSKSWDYGTVSLNYRLEIIYGITCRKEREHNIVCLALESSGECVGYLTAFIDDKPKRYHPLLFVVHALSKFLLLWSKRGRDILKFREMYEWHLNATVSLGKRALLGEDFKKVSEGLCVAVLPERRGMGVYREMARGALGGFHGYFIFHTSTECDWQAHEGLGFKKIFEVPYFSPSAEVSYIMCGFFPAASRLRR